VREYTTMPVACLCHWVPDGSSFPSSSMTMGWETVMGIATYPKGCRLFRPEAGPLGPSASGWARCQPPECRRKNLGANDRGKSQRGPGINIINQRVG